MVQSREALQKFGLLIAITFVAMGAVIFVPKVVTAIDVCGQCGNTDVYEEDGGECEWTGDTTDYCRGNVGWDLVSQDSCSGCPDVDYGTATINVSKHGTGSGNVSDTFGSSGGTLIDCGSDCSEERNVSSNSSGTSITLAASPHSGSTFEGWSGDAQATGSTQQVADYCGTSTTCSVWLPENQTTTVVATFDTSKYRIGVTARGEGTGTVSGGNGHINLNKDTSANEFDSHLYSSGERISFSASPGSGSTFEGWDTTNWGSTSTSSISILVNDRGMLYANFGEEPEPDPVTVTLDPVTGYDQVEYNDISYLEWKSTNADVCTPESNNFTTDGDTDAFYRSTGYLTSDTTFVIRCTNNSSGEFATDDAFVSVDDPVPNVTATLTADSPIPYGTSTTLAWNGENATSCTATSGNFDTRDSASNSTNTGQLTSDTWYEVRCDNSENSDTASTWVRVDDPDPPSVTFFADPSSVPHGTGTTLTWHGDNATSCTDTSGNFSTGGSVSDSTNTGPLTSDTSYGIECTGPGGTATANTSVSVDAPEPEINEFYADPQWVREGSNTTLIWSTEHASTCDLSTASGGSHTGVASPYTGGLAQGLTEITQYTLTCDNGDGDTVTDDTTVYMLPVYEEF